MNGMNGFWHGNHGWLVTNLDDRVQLVVVETAPTSPQISTMRSQMDKLTALQLAKALTDFASMPDEQPDSRPLED